jgi:hypothetical protein
MKSPIILVLALLSFSLSCSSSQRMSADKVVAQKEGQAASEHVKAENFVDQTQKFALAELDKAGKLPKLPIARSFAMPRSRSRFLQPPTHNTR